MTRLSISAVIALIDGSSCGTLCYECKNARGECQTKIVKWNLPNVCHHRTYINAFLKFGEMSTLVTVYRHNIVFELVQGPKYEGISCEFKQMTLFRTETYHDHSSRMEIKHFTNVT